MAQDDKSDKEKAEGSRENLNVEPPTDANWGAASGSSMERGPGQLSDANKGGSEQPRHDKGGKAEPGAGITNRPLEKERENQAEVPERGKTKREEKK